ncbi:carbonic anhydrase [Waterburya agarophytonicola K14]|uniref:Carbonic anhydrase n=1 Tax=Waterburya agarophytonicola KI4 TaxID=2874699 RepID=A0A964BNF9_9CYAN|nr:carbonic anhydrase [Waterburya agarophytonicola KI4]
MKKLIRGLDKFRETYVDSHQELLGQLAHSQTPRVLFITCSDSRVAPNLITDTDVGELFVIRNAGNIIPPYGAANGGEGGTIEYAINALNIEQIVICGHSNCGAMKGLLKLNKLQKDMPLVYDWLKHAESTRRMVQETYPHYEGDDLIEVLVAENVLIQIDNLKTYPIIRSRLHQGRLKIYAWIYNVETGKVLAYDARTHTYIPPEGQLLDDDDTVRSYVSCGDNTAVVPIKKELEALLKISPETESAAKEATRSLVRLFDKARRMGMNNIELQNYHSLFSESVQLWAEKIYSKV